MRHFSTKSRVLQVRTLQALHSKQFLKALGTIHAELVQVSGYLVGDEKVVKLVGLRNGFELLGVLFRQRVFTCCPPLCILLPAARGSETVDISA